MTSISHCISQISLNHSVFAAMLKDISKDHYKWKPNEKAWSILEIACHLLDEEKEDFKTRLDHVLHSLQKLLYRYQSG